MNWLLGLFSFTLLIACSSNDSSDHSWIGEQVESDGGRIVRTLQGQVWDDNARLVEELSIGANEEGPYLLESVSDIDVTDDRIYVLDNRAPILHVYNHDGHHIQDIGRLGEGPGEFRNPEQVSVDTEKGLIFVRDPSIQRFNLYSLQGDPIDHWNLQSRMFGSFPMIITKEGSLYTHCGTTLGYAMMRVDGEDSYSDTLYVPSYEMKSMWVQVANVNATVPFSPRRVWNIGPSASILAGFSNEYRFEIWRDNHQILIIEREASLIPVIDEEREWHIKNLFMRFSRYDPNWTWEGSEVPKVKPAFKRLVEDNLGRIWVFRAGPGKQKADGNWEDTLLIDVFDVDGRYLGAVDAPIGFKEFPTPFIERDTIVAQYIDELDIPYVKRYRIEYP